MNEQSAIRTLAAPFKRARNQCNQLFASDAEIIKQDDGYHLFTLDEFSAAEDRFSSSHPATLGANLATATLSDILATGGTPAYFMHAVCLPPEAPKSFLTALAEGIATVLDANNCHLIGGDVGQAPEWRFTGWAMGTCQRPLTRLLPDTPLDLWISGPLGGANAAVAADLPTPCFANRYPLLPILQEHAAACIDTSSGLWDALWTLRHLNPHHQLLLDLPAVPLAPTVDEVCLRAGLPRAAALIGAAGEYELLFAAPPEASPTLVAEGAVRIGHAHPSPQPGFIVHTTRQNLPAPACPDPRSFPDHHSYLACVLSAAHQLDWTDA